MSRLIVNIQGTSGSGKTTVARAILNQFPNEELWAPHPVTGKPRLSGYKIVPPNFRHPIYLIGPYKEGVASGGADGMITKVTDVVDMVRKGYEADGHVLVEAMMFSGSGFKSKWPAGINAIGNVKFAFLDTPVEVCIERVLARRAEAGNTKPFDPDNSLTGTWKSCQKCMKLYEENPDYDSVVIDHTQATKQVFNLFLEAEADV